MANQVLITGRLCFDLELQTTPNNTPFIRNVLAVPVWGKSDETDFIPVEIWAKNAENLMKFEAGKGDKILIQGSIRVDKWEDKDGNKKERTKVVAQTWEFLQKKKSEEPGF